MDKVVAKWEGMVPVHRASCIMHRASCIVHRCSCMHSCIQTGRRASTGSCMMKALLLCMHWSQPPLARQLSSPTEEHLARYMHGSVSLAAFLLHVLASDMAACHV